MTHQRRAIREAVKNLLVDETDAEDRVFTNRPTSLWEVPSPSILIFALNEASQKHIVSTNQSRRKMNLAIEVRIQLPQDGELITDLDDQLDQMAFDIETRINTDTNLEDAANDITLVSTEIELSDEGDVPEAAMRMTYEVSYIF